MFDFRPWVALTYLGILTALTGVIVDFFLVYVLNKRISFIKESESMLGFMAFVLIGFVMITFASFLGDYFSPMVDGSGVPEIKSILSGANTYKYLDFNIFFPKILGLIAAYGAGLSVGKVGPLIHLGAILANTLLKLKPFKHLDKNYAMKRSIITASVGCAVTVALDAPIGGLIYSIEISMGYFNVTNVFRTFFSICWCLVTMKILNPIIRLDSLVPTEFPDYYIDLDIFSFVGLGIFIGLMTVGFLKMSIKLIYLRKNLKLRIFERYAFVWLSYTIITLTTFSLELATQSSRLIQNDSFSSKELSENLKISKNPLLSLTLYVITKWLSISLTFACNFPFGIFGPPFDIGAAAGRWFAEIGGILGLFNPIAKGAYGVAGSAACVTCVVRSIAPIAVVMEMTFQIKYAVPITITVLFSYLVGNLFSMSFFDVSLYLRKLPVMASLMSKENYEKTAGDLMLTNYPVVFNDSTHRGIFETFLRMGSINKALMLPIIDSEGILVGAVKIELLLKYLEAAEQTEIRNFVRILQSSKPDKKIDLEENGLKELEGFFNQTRTFYEKEVHVEGDSRIVQPDLQMKTFKTNDQLSIEMENPVEKFLAERVYWKQDILQFDPSPLIVTPECYASKIQFLFTVTKATCIFVTERGKLLGCITSVDFLKQKN